MLPIRARVAEVLEGEHWAHDALDGSVILLDNVVEMLRLVSLSSLLIFSGMPCKLLIIRIRNGSEYPVPARD